MASFLVDSASFRDPSGFIFEANGQIYRQVNQSYMNDFKLLMDSGLYGALTAKKFLIPHTDVEDHDFPMKGGYKIIQPERIPYISYPYEWSFSMLQDAALLTLKIQKQSLQHGMTLKDASAYNIQFHGSKPVFIDTLSFEKFDGKPWAAYKQFCQHFLAPLALIGKTDFRLGKLLSVYIDGVPLDLASQLLPQSSKLNFGLLTHIHLHSRSQRKYANEGRDENVGRKVAAMKFTPQKAIALIDHLYRTVETLRWKLADTEWGNYYQDTNYQDSALKEKAEAIKSFFSQLPADCSLLQDLGANDGKFGREIKDYGSLVVCHDIDESAVEKNYLAARSAKDEKILPLVQDLSNPSAAIGWGNAERRSLSGRATVDVSMALALIHHLAISNNVPLEKIASYFSSLSRYLIIEFVAKSDSQVRRLLTTREDIFPDYTTDGFESEFGKYFKLMEKHPISNTDRTLYLFQSLSMIQA